MTKFAYPQWDSSVTFTHINDCQRDGFKVYGDIIHFTPEPVVMGDEELYYPPQQWLDDKGNLCKGFVCSSLPPRSPTDEEIALLLDAMDKDMEQQPGAGKSIPQCLKLVGEYYESLSPQRRKDFLGVIKKDTRRMKWNRILRWFGIRRESEMMKDAKRLLTPPTEIKEEDN